MAHADPVPRADPANQNRWRSLIAVAATCSLLVLEAPLSVAQPDCKTIEDFSKAKVGEFPADCKPRKDSGKDAYRVMEEPGLRFLRAVVRGLGVQAAKQYEWDLEAYPVLAWSWRARGVSLLVPYARVAGPKAIKYIWSERVPVGTRLSSNAGLTQVRVLRSGPPAKKGEWVEERVNARDDYNKYFDVQETPKPAGIAVLTDSDDTSSTPQGNSPRFRACPQ